jgi:hypothetical protein
MLSATKSMFHSSAETSINQAADPRPLRAASSRGRIAIARLRRGRLLLVAEFFIGKPRIDQALALFGSTARPRRGRPAS